MSHLHLMTFVQQTTDLSNSTYFGTIWYGKHRLTESRLFAVTLSADRTTGAQCEMGRKNAKTCSLLALKILRDGLGESDVNESQLQQLPISLLCEISWPAIGRQISEIENLI